MRRRIASINDLAIEEASRLFHWDRGETGRRPDDHPGLSDLSL
jgi:nuclear transport factor 2 (NTF2) superfamily protein